MEDADEITIIDSQSGARIFIQREKIQRKLSNV